MAILDEFEHPSSLHSKGRVFNADGTDYYLRGTPVNLVKFDS